jgi:hypothetical protein
MDRTCSIHSGDEKHIQKYSFEKPEGNRQHVIPSYRWVDNIKIDLTAV